METENSRSNNDNNLFDGPSIVSISTKSGGSVNETIVT